MDVPRRRGTSLGHLAKFTRVVLGLVLVLAQLRPHARFTLARNSLAVKFLLAANPSARIKEGHQDIPGVDVPAALTRFVRVDQLFRPSA